MEPKKFYHDIKPHISPSALDNWHNARGQFVKSYFDGVKFQGSAATRAGSQIHALIQGGMLTVKHRYNRHEEELVYDIEHEGLKWRVLGIPDSFGAKADGGNIIGCFVDYKSGKENNWDAARLAADLKMKCTAFLVWKELGEPTLVRGSIEYLPTVWNPHTKEVEYTGGESEVAGEIEYTGAELAAFQEFIVKTMKEINAAYEVYQKSTDEFVNQDDVAEYVELERQVTELCAKQDAIRDRIAEQMKFGSRESITTVFGSFYFTTRRKWQYPAELKINYLNMGLTFEDFEKIEAAAAAAKKKWEVENPPQSTSTTLGFRAAKKK